MNINKHSIVSYPDYLTDLKAPSFQPRVLTILWHTRVKSRKIHFILSSFRLGKLEVSVYAVHQATAILSV